MKFKKVIDTGGNPIRKILSYFLFKYNLVIISLIRILNFFFISKKINTNSIVIFNIQYVQRYSIVEAIYASYLKSKGYKVKATICAGYNYCEQKKFYLNKPDCGSCRSKTMKLIEAANLDKVDLLEYKDELRVKPMTFNKFNIKKHKRLKDIETSYPIGETLYWNWLHYSNGYLLPHNDIATKKVLYEIYLSVSESFYAFEKMLTKNRPEIVISCNGRFGQTRPAQFLKNKFKYICVGWEHFAQRDYIVWLKNVCAMDQDISNYWQDIRYRKLNEIQFNELTQNLDTQKKGKNIKYNILKNINFENKNKIIEILKIDKNKPIVSIFLNMTWDSACLPHGIEDLDFFETTDFIIKNAHKYKNIQFVIRAHPAETSLPERLRASESTIHTLSKINKTLPKNVTLIESNSNISSYRLCEISDEALFFSSTLGIETLLKNKRITTLGGSCYYAGKGFTNDIKTKSDLLEYFSKINDSFLKKGKRGSLAELNQVESEMVKTLAYYIRFKLFSRMPIIKRGILLLTPLRYIKYIQLSGNLLKYINGERLPFQLDNRD